MKRLVLCLSLCTTVTLAATVNYTYDNSGRLTRIDYDNGTSIAYVYDPAGNLLSRTVTAASGASAAKRSTPSGADRAHKKQSRKQQ